MRVLIAALMVAGPAYAHSWYPIQCCSLQDCKPVPVSDVTILDGKWIVSWGGQEIEFDQARPSPDGQFHICTRGGIPSASVIEVQPNRPIPPGPCFWAPGGM